MSEARDRMSSLIGDSYDVLCAKLASQKSVSNFSGALDVCPFLEMIFNNIIIYNNPEHFSHDQWKHWLEFFFDYLTMFIIVGDYDGARHLWRRIHAHIKSGNTDLSSMWNVGALLMQQNMPGAHAILNSEEWSPHADKEMIGQVRKALRASQWELLSKAYSCVAMSTIAGSQCMTSDEAFEECKRLGWPVDGNGNVHPRPIVVSHDGHDEERLRSSMEMIARLSENVALFEKKTLKVDLTGKST